MGWTANHSLNAIVHMQKLERSNIKYKGQIVSINIFVIQVISTTIIIIITLDNILPFCMQQLQLLLLTYFIPTYNYKMDNRKHKIQRNAMNDNKENRKCYNNNNKNNSKKKQ